MAFPETLMAPHSFRLYFTSLCLLALVIESATAQQRPYPPEVVISYITNGVKKPLITSAAMSPEIILSGTEGER